MPPVKKRIEFLIGFAAHCEVAMAHILSGKPVAAALLEEASANVEQLKRKSIRPTLCIVRLGEDPSDLSYERGILKRADQVGIHVQQEILPQDASAQQLTDVLRTLSEDDDVHGVLLFRPLPKQLRSCQAEIFAALDPAKDVDGMTDGSAAGVFLGKPLGFAPCTPSACMELLRYYEIDPCGMQAVVVGRSPVVGKPLAMLLLNQNATVTICHTKTKGLSTIARQAELLVACAGVAGMLGQEEIAPGAVVLDVGVNWSESLGRYVGDVRAEEAEAAAAITPVPGGVGAVTTAILLRNVVMAAMEQERRSK